MNDILYLFIGIALFLIIFMLSIRLLIGRGAEEQMVGQLAADVIRFLFLLPFRLLRWLARRIGLIR